MRHHLKILKKGFNYVIFDLIQLTPLRCKDLVLITPLVENVRDEKPKEREPRYTCSRGPVFVPLLVRPSSMPTQLILRIFGCKQTL
jgi:hypothetical protein